VWGDTHAARVFGLHAETLLAYRHARTGIYQNGAIAEKSLGLIQKGPLSMDAFYERTAEGSPQPSLAKPAPLDQVAVHPNFKYHNGPVLVSPIVYSIFLGQLWNVDADHAQRMNLLKEFLSDLPFSGFMNVLSQYGCGFGAGNAGCSLQSETLPVGPGDTGDIHAQMTITDSEMQNLLQGEITKGFLPQPGTPATTCVIVYLADNVNVQDELKRIVTCLSEDGAFGYHGHFTTNKGDSLAYGLVSSASDNCLNNVCAQHQGICNLSFARPQVERQTMVTSHEYAEMLTNPTDGGWFCDPNGDPGKELADITQGVFPDPTASGTITAGSKTWTVQKIYSITDALAGRDPAVVSAPSPLPKLPLAPVPHRVPLARIHELHRIEKLLPLPNAYYDAVQGGRKWDEEATRALLRRLFHPYRPQDFVPDLPRLLRHIADLIDKEGK
jgi:hypothetical protein